MFPDFMCLIVFVICVVCVVSWFCVVCRLAVVYCWLLVVVACGVGCCGCCFVFVVSVYCVLLFV